MIKKLTLALGVLFLAGTSYADTLTNGPYLSGHIGADHSTYQADGEKKTDTRMLWDMAVGARVRSLRFELNIASTNRANIDDVKLEQQRYTAQFYYDLPIRSVVRPFLNAGLGAAYAEITIPNYTKDNNTDTTFCWNVGAGLGLNVSRRLSFEIGYRYIDAGKPKFYNDTISMKVHHHEGYTGVRFTF